MKKIILILLLSTLPSYSFFNLAMLKKKSAVGGCASSGSQTFSYTGANQTFVVPTGCTTVTVKAWGAGGGGGSVAYSGGGLGGAGGYATQSLSVTAAETLNVHVGQGGRTGAFSYASGGGGYSAVFRGGQAHANVLLAAAGGGGAGINGSGGAGGGTTGSTAPGGAGGTGGTQVAGGNAGGANGGAGGQLIGGLANGTCGAFEANTSGWPGGASSVYGAGAYNVGGGGGGFYGGGSGGCAGTPNNQGGGGGSSYAPTGSTTAGVGAIAPNTADPSYAPGLAVGGATNGGAGGNGRVVFTWGAAVQNFVAYADAASTVTTGGVIINKPAGTAENDYLIAAIATANCSVTAPAGWSQRSSYFWPGYSYYSNVFTKIATGAEGASYTFGDAGCANGYRGMIVTYRNAGYVGIGAVAQSATATVVAPSVGSTQNGDLALTIALDRSTAPLYMATGLNKYSASGASAFWSGLIQESNVTGANSGTRTVDRTVTWDATAVNVILRPYTPYRYYKITYTATACPSGQSCSPATGIGITEIRFENPEGAIVSAGGTVTVGAGSTIYNGATCLTNSSFASNDGLFGATAAGNFTIDLGANKMVKKASIWSGTAANQYPVPTDFTISGSTDNSTWTVLKTVTGQIWPNWLTQVDFTW